MELNTTTDGWSDPIDESPVELSTGWHYGSVVHTGGGIYNRIFHSTDNPYGDSEDGDVRYEIGYDDTFRGVAAERYVYDDEFGGWRFDGIVETADVDRQTDEACANAARELMEAYPDD